MGSVGHEARHGGIVVLGWEGTGMRVQETFWVCKGLRGDEGQRRGDGKGKVTSNHGHLEKLY